MPVSRTQRPPRARAPAPPQPAAEEVRSPGLPCALESELRPAAFSFPVPARAPQISSPPVLFPPVASDLPDGATDRSVKPPSSPARAAPLAPVRWGASANGATAFDIDGSSGSGGGSARRGPSSEGGRTNLISSSDSGGGGETAGAYGPTKAESGATATAAESGLDIPWGWAGPGTAGTAAEIPPSGGGDGANGIAGGRGNAGRGGRSDGRSSTSITIPSHRTILSRAKNMISRFPVPGRQAPLRLAMVVDDLRPRGSDERWRLFVRPAHPHQRQDQQGAANAKAGCEVGKHGTEKGFAESRPAYNAEKPGFRGRFYRLDMPIHPLPPVPVARPPAPSGPGDRGFRGSWNTPGFAGSRQASEARQPFFRPPVRRSGEAASDAWAPADRHF